MPVGSEAEILTVKSRLWLTIVGLLSEIDPVGLTLITVTTQVAVFPPSAVVTKIVTLPTETGVTTPELLTVATAVLLELHVTF
jgi:hypothetical protein